ncbi:MAG: HD domain-containing protein [Candidatus Moraniibacteriota bacterium]
MFLSERIDRAIERATVLHGKQERKMSGSPYIIHPYAVAFLLAHFVDDEDVIIAGLLHDTLEDVPGYTESMLEQEFGPRVTSIVKEVTEDFTLAEKSDHSKRRDSWQRRKELYIENLKNDSPEALLVAAADKIHNMRSLMSGYRTGGEEALEDFSASKDKMLWYYKEVAEVIGARLTHPLVDELRRVLVAFQAAFVA